MLLEQGEQNPLYVFEKLEKLIDRCTLQKEWYKDQLTDD